MSRGVSSFEAVKLGKRLLALRQKCGPRGGFLQALPLMAPNISQRSAYAYMAAAETFGNQPEKILRRFSLGAVTRLAGPAVHPDVVADALAMAEQDEYVSDEVAQEMIAGAAEGGKWLASLPSRKSDCNRSAMCRILLKMPNRDFEKFRSLAYEIKDTNPCASPKVPTAKPASP